MLGGLVEQVALVAQARGQAHHDFLANRVDRRVGDLREQLLEVGEQRRRLVGEHRQREVVAHRADRLGAVDRHRREQHPQVLLRVAERALAQVQRLVGERDLLGRGQLGEGHGVAREPLAVGMARGDLALDLLVLDDPSALEVHQEQLARLQAPETPYLLGRDVEQAGLRAEHHVPVGRLDPASGAQAVAVERRSHHAPIGERHRRRPVPRLHHAGVERVEALQVVRQVVAVAERLGDHHHRRVRQRAPGQHQQLEHVVERRRVGVAGGDDRQDLLEVLAEQLAAQLRLAGAHPVDVAHHRVDLAVVADHAVGVRQLPAGERVGREARVHERERALGALVAEVLVELAQLVADQHALVVDRARGARRDVQPGLPGGQVADPADHVELALECVLLCALRVIARLRRAGPDEQLADHRPAGGGHLSRVLLVDRHVTPAQQPLPLVMHDALQQRLQAPARVRVGRQEAHQHAVLARGRQLEVDHRAQQLVGHLHQDPRAVARARVRAGGAAVLEVLKRRDRPRDHLVRGHVVQARHHAHAARVVLEAGVVESDGLWRLLDVRVHGSAPLRRCIPAEGGQSTLRAYPPRAGRRAPEAERKA